MIMVDRLFLINYSKGPQQQIDADDSLQILRLIPQSAG